MGACADPYRRRPTAGGFTTVFAMALARSSGCGKKGGKLMQIDEAETRSVGCEYNECGEW